MLQAHTITTAPSKQRWLHSKRRSVRWLHIPKAGSAFINVLARYACPSLVGSNVSFAMAFNFSHWWPEHSESHHCQGLQMPWAGHVPVRPQERAPGQRMLVGVFRAPAQRLISGFHHTEHGQLDSMIAPGMPNQQRAAMQQAAAGDPGKYARWPGIASCATKMLLGSQCASQRRVDAVDVERAVRALESFAFVGLLEHWAASVCVFHALLMSGTPPDATELAVTHAGQQRVAAAAARATGRTDSFRYDEGVLRGFVDVHDERVYAAARTRFWADARRTRCDVHDERGLQRAPAGGEARTNE